MTIAEGAHADQVRLKNGDVVRGTNLTLSEGQVKISSGPFGDLTVAADEVQSIQTDAPVWIVFKKQGKARGVIEPNPSGGMTLRADGLGGGTSFDMAVIETVAPGDADPDVTKTMWKTEGGINVGSTFASGNDNYEQVHIDGSFVARRLDTRYTLRGEADYLKEDEEETVKKGLLKGKQDLFFTDRWFFYTGVGFEHDAAKNLNLRTDIGAGAGYQVYDTERTALSFEGGLSYVIEEYETDENESYPAARFATDFRYDPVLDKIRLFHFNEFFQDLTGDNGFTVRTRTGIRYFLGEGLNATAQVNYDWESETVEGQEQSDTIYLFTLGYAW